MRLQNEYLPATGQAQYNVVLLHGWGCGADIWRPLLVPLRPGVNVTLVDLPGCAPGVACADDLSLSTLLADILACAPQEAVFIGWSLGGQIALELAARYPERVLGVVTLCSNPKFIATADWPGMELEVFRQFRQTLIADPVGAMRRFDALQARGASRPRALLRQLRALERAPATRALLTGLDWLADLDQRHIEVAPPRLHLLGDCDALVPVSIAAVMKRCGGLEVERIDGASHLMPLQNTDRVYEMICRFLARLPLLENPAPPVEGVAKRHVAASFSRAAKGYDAVAHLQREVGKQLLSCLDEHPSTVSTVLDLGCGTGHFQLPLEQRFPAAHYLGLDIAEGMVLLARERSEGRGNWVQADAEALPLSTASVDLVFSSLALQWCYRLDHLFGEIARVLVTGGCCVFATLGPGTLRELREAWAAVDQYQHVNAFLDAAALEAAVAASAGLTLRFEQRSYELKYDRVGDLLHELKALGAHNMNPRRPSGLASRRALQAMLRSYERWRKPDGLPATYDVIFAVVEKL